MLTDNRDVLDAIAKTLIEKEKINGEELLNVINSVKPGLISEEAIKAVTAIMTPKVDENQSPPDLTPAPAMMKKETM